MECVARNVANQALGLSPQTFAGTIGASQALTTPRKIRLPIGQPVGKNQVAPTVVQVAPFGRELL